MDLRQMRGANPLIPQGQPEIMGILPSNVTPSREPERPLLLNSWTQTSSEDFNYLQAINPRYEQPSVIEMELRERIRTLENNLNAHVAIISQIHATAAQTNNLQMEMRLQEQRQQQQQIIQQTRGRQHYQEAPPASVIQQLPQVQQPHFVNQPEKQHDDAQPAQRVVNLPPKGVGQSLTAVINPVQQIPNPDSVNYRIIAEAYSESNGAPIEIRLADEENNLNLNSSADSGRLEICLPDEPSEANKSIVKMEFTPPLPPPIEEQSDTSSSTSSSTSSINVKRRKTVVRPRAPISNICFNEQGMLTSITALPAAGASHQNDNQRTQFSDTLKMDNDMVTIGPNKTQVPIKVYEKLPWHSASVATRRLLAAIFDRKTLSTHSMSGKPSPAFRGKPLKKMLNPLIIDDIVFAVMRNSKASEKEVRAAITTKCADENKMVKQMKMKEQNKENMN